MEEKSVSGIIWWKPEQWEKAKKISDDSHAFDDTYKDWKVTAEKMLISFHNIGIKVYKIEIDLDELVQWCKDQKVPLDSGARSRFATMKVEELHDSQ
jgi:hypothetical protein